MPDKVYKIEFNTAVTGTGLETAVAQIGKVESGAKKATQSAEELEAQMKAMGKAYREESDAKGAEALASVFGKARERVAALKQEIASTTAELHKLDGQFAALDAGGFGSGGGATNTGGFLGASGAKAAAGADPFGDALGAFGTRVAGIGLAVKALKDVVTAAVGPELDKLKESWTGLVRAFAEDTNLGNLGGPIKQLSGWMNDLSGATDKARAAEQEKANADQLAAFSASEVAKAEAEHTASLQAQNQASHEAARNAQTLIEKRKAEAELARENAKVDTERQLLEINNPARIVSDAQKIEEAGAVKVAAMEKERQEKLKTLAVEKEQSERVMKEANDSQRQAQLEEQAARRSVDAANALTGPDNEPVRAKAEARLKGAEESRKKATEARDRELERYNKERSRQEAEQKLLDGPAKEEIENARRKYEIDRNAAQLKENDAAEKAIEAEQKARAEKLKKEQQQRDSDARAAMKSGLSPTEVAMGENGAIPGTIDEARGVISGLRKQSQHGDTTTAIGNVEKALSALDDGATQQELKRLVEAMAALAQKSGDFSASVQASIRDVNQSVQAQIGNLDRRINDLQSTSGNSGF